MSVAYAYFAQYCPALHISILYISICNRALTTLYMIRGGPRITQKRRDKFRSGAFVDVRYLRGGNKGTRMLENLANQSESQDYADSYTVLIL